MKDHRSSVGVAHAPVLEVCPVTLRSGRRSHTPHELVALLVGQANERVPAPLVAQRLGRSQSTVYAWAHAASAGGLRLVDLPSAPRPWQSLILRGLLAQIEPPRCGTPSRIEVVRLMSHASQLLLAASELLPSNPSSEEQERLRRLSEALRQSSAAQLAKADEIDEILRQAAANKTRKG